MPKPLPISEFFAQTLNAPLRNRVWSWGSLREADGVLFLRCWSDQFIQIDGGRAIEVLRPGKNLLRRKPGRVERNALGVARCVFREGDGLVVVPRLPAHVRVRCGRDQGVGPFVEQHGRGDAGGKFCHGRCGQPAILCMEGGGHKR